MRKINNLNQGWRFIREDVGLPVTLPEHWQKVGLPHTWNTVDGMDGNGSYYRGRCWYARAFETPKQPLPGGRVYVEVLAAGQQAAVYVNGKEAVYHEGGYSIFRADITDLCKEDGENLLAVSCDNSEKSSVYPQSADFTFYGGLYRGVNLISVPDTHFDLDYYGGPGLRVTPRSCGERGGAKFELESWVTNPDENFTVMYSIKNAEGHEVASAVRPADSTEVSQLKELIVQNYNHPSICFWGISNEILIGGISDKLVENHFKLNKLAHDLDHTRLTTIAHLSMTPTNGLIHHITDVESYNHYFGWYGGKMEDNGPWLDKYHTEHPDTCLGLSEYGCEGIITYHGPEPACKDYSEEYQALYHEHMAKVLSERPWIWSSHVWNMFDFGCAARNEGGVGGRNNKGLVTMDRRTKKDSYYIYQAYWSKTPMVHICGRRYAQRAGETTEIRVYSNQPEVELLINGMSMGKQTGDKVFVFTVALEPGFNTVAAKAGATKDSITLENVTQEPAIYVLPEVKDRAEGVANWFKLAGDLDLTAPMEFPEGKYSVKDSMEVLARSPEALEVAAKAIKLATNFDLVPGMGMWNVMKSMTPERMMAMGGSTLPQGFLESLNAKLIKIDRI